MSNKVISEVFTVVMKATMTSEMPSKVALIAATTAITIGDAIVCSLVFRKFAMRFNNYTFLSIQNAH